MRRARSGRQSPPISCKLPLGHPVRLTGGCLQINLRDGHLHESIKAWQRYSKRAAGILTIAAKLHEERQADNSDWSGLLELPADLDAPGCTTDTLEGQKNTLSNLVCQWLNECEVRPVLLWQESKIDFQLGSPYRSLLSAIGIQLLSAVLGHGYAVCSGCGSPYAPTRQPRAGQNQYCRRCKKTVKNRIAQRKYAQRHQRKGEPK